MKIGMPARNLAILILFAMAASTLGLELEAVERAHPWELGFGVVGGWKHLEEATPQDPFRVAENAGFGFALTGGRWLGTRVKLSFDVDGTLQDTNLQDVQVSFVTFTLGIRGYFLSRGPIRPYLRGSFGGAKSTLESSAGGDERVELSGMAAVMGGGLHMAPSRRLRFDLELSHSVVEYEDAAVVFESIYIGTRINKAASATRIRFCTLFLI